MEPYGYNKKKVLILALYLNKYIRYLCLRKRMKAFKILVTQISCNEVEIKHKCNR